MIIAIELSTAPITDGVPEDGEVVYTDKIAMFVHESVALSFAEGKDHIMLIDCGDGTIIKDALIKVACE